ncbi:anchored repeat ABC transporter, substrate-binding protein [Microbacterium sp. BWT-B31]|uniref:anchored repeat ABC transporter, substrate-binding protein n=1 Tax=Microbacterium sp. BWT-B31 TaxID=3232072 RepID=UPI0035276D10
MTTTGILADLARNVAGDRAEVTSIVPDGADPHSYEPTLRNVRDIVYADVAFTNYLLLEEQSIIKALDANLRRGIPNISLAESAVKYAAEIIPLVEDISLDTVWLGVRVTGDGSQLGADRSSDVLLSATGMTGPGDLHAYLTGTFGDVAHYIDSTDGFDETTGYRADTMLLPPDAHTHLSWAFTEPGIYELDVQAKLQVDPQSKPIPIAEDTIVFAVGVDAHTVPGREQAQVLDSGHSDLTVDLDRGVFQVVRDHEHGSGGAHQEILDVHDVVVEVPGKALHEIPGDPSFRFLGRAGEPVYQLPQAVLGKHIHGEIDPHLWQNVRNAMAYVEIMRDTLTQADPEGAREYRDNARRYLGELERLDDDVRAAIASIPPSRRVLVTTHDAFGYLAAAYDMTIAGFVTPDPASEPSIAERKRLTQTIQNLNVPAVFLEPNLAARSSTLVEVAKEQGVQVCPIYGDALDESAPTYTDMIRANAASLVRCLTD